jgi:hypothetical protein
MEAFLLDHGNASEGCTLGVVGPVLEIEVALAFALTFASRKLIQVATSSSFATVDHAREERHRLTSG